MVWFFSLKFYGSSEFIETLGRLNVSKKKITLALWGFSRWFWVLVLLYGLKAALLMNRIHAMCVHYSRTICSRIAIWLQCHLVCLILGHMNAKSSIQISSQLHCQSCLSCLHMHSFRHDTLLALVWIVQPSSKVADCAWCQKMNELKLDQLAKHLRLTQRFGSSPVAISGPLIITQPLGCWAVFTL